MRQIISEEKRWQIITALKGNPNVTQVARKIGGVNNTTVGKIAKAAGIALAGAEYGKRLSAEKRAQITTALKDNPNATQVARKIGGVNYRTVVRLAEGAGIELTAGKAARRGGISPEKRAQIITALKDNPNATQVARKIGGVSNTTVGKIAKAAGIALAGAEYGKRLSAEKRAQITTALKANPNAAEVAGQIGGVTHVAVWKIAKAAGIELTRGKAASDHRPNEISR